MLCVVRHIAKVVTPVLLVLFFVVLAADEYYDTVRALEDLRMESCMELEAYDFELDDDDEPDGVEQNAPMAGMTIVETGAAMMAEALERVSVSPDDFHQMTNMENEINNLRNELKNRNMQSITEREYDYSVGANYMDIVRELERMADYIINVEEALYAHKHDKNRDNITFFVKSLCNPKKSSTFGTKFER